MLYCYIPPLPISVSYDLSVCGHLSLWKTINGQVYLDVLENFLFSQLK